VAPADVLVATLQRMIDRLADDAAAALDALAQAATPEPARRSLAGALSYLVEQLDMVPDHLDGLGAVDDAIVLRMAARHAVSHGSDDLELRRLAGEAPVLAAVLGDLFAPVDEIVSRLPSQEVRGRTPAEVFADPESRVAMWLQVAGRLAAYQPAQLVGTYKDADTVLRELRQIMLPRLRRAGLVP
jgi:uncharacterized membrane protein YkvA (DUF1232 family)